MIAIKAELALVTCPLLWKIGCLHKKAYSDISPPCWRGLAWLVQYLSFTFCGANMRAKEYQLMEECVMDGIARGFRVSFKHTDDPSHEMIKEKLWQEIMSEISEWFDFEEPSND